MATIIITRTATTESGATYPAITDATAPLVDARSKSVVVSFDAAVEEEDDEVSVEFSQNRPTPKRSHVQSPDDVL